ncbi:NAD(P)/FAD-dependent oxidoreductase [Pseudonocardia sp. CA-142604]|uniref:NAD(P)/FAD-dependent oxidoreductase n=1 Tax=Pseudonocardia sp. CA-142604 TaxID=3240024 RepID=UPI003D94508E
MSEVLIIGGGFAGVWSAVAAVGQRRAAGVPESDMRVTLVSAGDDLVIRPRLYEADPERMRLSLDRVLGPIGVARVAATITGIDTQNREVSGVARDGTSMALPYHRLVLATGSHVVRPSLPGAEHLFDIDTLAGAAAMEAHLQRLPSRPATEGRFTVVVVGAGFTGIEIATELGWRLRAIAGETDPVRVVLVDRNENVGHELGEGPRPQILEALNELGVERRLGVSLQSVTPEGARLSDGSEIAAATVIWTAGMVASPLTAQVPAPRDSLGRLAVDDFLRVVGVPGVYAAGDTAAPRVEEGQTVMQSCQYAIPQGHFAGVNAAADLLGTKQTVFAPPAYVTCLDLGPAGAVLTTGWNRKVVATREDAKNVKQMINAELIYPPIDDAEAILAWALEAPTLPFM